MPKLKNSELTIVDNDASDVEEMEMSNGTVYELTVDTVNPTRFSFSKPLKYDYPLIVDGGIEREMTQEEKQSYRRRERRNKERLAQGKPINPNQNRVKKSPEEKKLARSNRRQIRNSIKYLAIEQLSKLEQYKGMSPDDIYLSLRDELTHKG